MSDPGKSPPAFRFKYGPSVGRAHEVSIEYPETEPIRIEAKWIEASKHLNFCAERWFIKRQQLLRK